MSQVEVIPEWWWQLIVFLLGGWLMARAMVAAGHRWRWPSAQPAFWWASLALVLLPWPLAHLWPNDWVPSASNWHWIDPGVHEEARQDGGPEAPAVPHALYERAAECLLGVWSLGVLWIALIGIRGRMRLQALLSACRPLPCTSLPGRRSQRLARGLLRHGIRLQLCPMPRSPFAIRRRIVLPEPLLSRLDDTQCWLLLRHEATHLRLGDPWWQSLLGLLVALHWFHPAIRLLADRLRLATELRCDARALGQRKHMRRAYAEAYLEALRMSATRTLPCPGAAFSLQDQGHHKMRIAHILSAPASPSKRRVSLLCVAALGTGLMQTAAQAAGLGSAASVSGGVPAFRGPIVNGAISSRFGVQRPSVSTVPHGGIDLKGPRGTPVRAPADGVVLTAEAPFSEAPRYGSVVILDHGNGWHTLYAHLDSIAVQPGDAVRAGDTLGGLGSTGFSTGPHVHVEVHHDGERIDPATVIESLAGPRS